MVEIVINEVVIFPKVKIHQERTSLYFGADSITELNQTESMDLVLLSTTRSSLDSL